MLRFAAAAIPHADLTRLVHDAGRPVQIEQSERWAAIERSLPGREPWRCLEITGDDGPVAVLALTRYSGRAMTQLWAKHGPIWLIDAPTPEQERALRAAVADYVRREDPRAALVRLHALDSYGCTEPLVATQWDRTVILDIDRSDDEIMATMSKSGRRDLRYGLKNDEIEIVDDTQISAAEFERTIYPIFAQTAERAGFGLMSSAHYYAILEQLRPEHALLLTARKDGEVVCWGLFTELDGAATYYFAASSAAARSTFAVYKLLWRAIGILRDGGARTLDFYGVSSPRCPELASLDDFKLKWTKGEAVDVAGAWDVVLRPRVLDAYHARNKAVALARRGVRELRALPGRARRHRDAASETEHQ